MLLINVVANDVNKCCCKHCYDCCCENFSILILAVVAANNVVKHSKPMLRKNVFIHVDKKCWWNVVANIVANVVATLLQMLI